MEEGSLRCDANVSVRPHGQAQFGTKAEVKNVNSFRYVEKALEYEIGRQIDLLESGGRVVQETRLFDSGSGRTHSMRSKEEAHDYRYFPEPDLPPLVVDEARIARVRASMPELPAARRQRFVEQYAIPDYDAGVLTQSAGLADYFEAVAAAAGNPKAASNWVMGELLRTMNERGQDIADQPLAGGPAGRSHRADRQGDHQQLDCQGRLCADVRLRPGGRRDRRAGGPRADRRRVGAAGHHPRRDRRQRRRGGAVSSREDADVRLSRRSGDEGQQGQGEPEARQRAAEERARQLVTQATQATYPSTEQL